MKRKLTEITVDEAAKLVELAMNSGIPEDQDPITPEEISVDEVRRGVLAVAVVVEFSARCYVGAVYVRWDWGVVLQNEDGHDEPIEDTAEFVNYLTEAGFDHSTPIQ